MDATCARNTINAKRLEKNVTIAQVAEAVHKSPVFVGRRVTGKSSIDP